MIAIVDLLTPVTADQQLEKFLSMLEAVGLPARSWRAGGALRTILRILASVYAAFSVLALGFAQSAFLETSAGGWLTLVAYYGYGVARIPAAYAVGQVTLTNVGGGVYTFAPGAFLVHSTVTGNAYSNVSAFTLNATSTLTINVQALNLGTASNANPSDVSLLETTLPGVTCTNAASIVGSDAEADPDLQARSLNRLAVISGLGPRGAYAFAVRSAVRGDGSAVFVNRQRISPSSSTGVVTVVVASPNGAPLSSDLPFISASIEQYARPDTVTVNLVAATPLPLTETITVWATSSPGATAPDIATLVATALTNAMTTYPVGGIAKPPSTQGYLYGDFVAGVAKSAHSSIFDIDGADSDTLMNTTDVATLAATISVRFVQVST